MTNYIKLKPGLFYQNYVFFDVEQYYADNLFIQHMRREKKVAQRTVESGQELLANQNGFQITRNIKLSWQNMIMMALIIKMQSLILLLLLRIL